MSELCLTPAKLAAHFGVGASRVYAALKNGEIPHFRVGDLYRIRPSDVPAALVERWSGRAGAFDGLPHGVTVYFLGVPDFVKIGWTTDLGRRAYELQAGSPHRFELLAYLPEGTIADERAYHRQFREHRAEGEWFTRCPPIEAEIERLRSFGPCLDGAGR